MGGQKTSRSHPPARILKVYIEVLKEFSHIHSPDGRHNTLLSQGWVFERVPSAGTMGRTHIPRKEEGIRSF